MSTSQQTLPVEAELLQALDDAFGDQRWILIAFDEEASPGTGAVLTNGGLDGRTVAVLRSIAEDLAARTGAVC
ncbi:MAG: hypothetical protein BWX69_03148 [Planctomycetes bacterium ADurb.Bin069]|nr:MAG: hypothetical protein BWX69_03148 [Planctomycetes bacterium ADurb.Bin069]